MAGFALPEEAETTRGTDVAIPARQQACKRARLGECCLARWACPVDVKNTRDTGKQGAQTGTLARRTVLGRLRVDVGGWKATLKGRNQPLAASAVALRAVDRPPATLSRPANSQYGSTQGPFPDPSRRQVRRGGGMRPVPLFPSFFFSYFVFDFLSQGASSTAPCLTASGLPGFETIAAHPGDP